MDIDIDIEGLSTATLFDDASDASLDAASREPGGVVGRYVLERELGAGGMGEVWAAWDPQLERALAIKFLRHVEHEIDRARLLREAQAMARLSHPNIVVVHDVGEVGGALFVAMERVHGQTLRQWQSAASRSWSEIVAVYLQAARGLAAAHEVGLVHRDFKPDNAMIEDGSGRVRVMDFGLAAIIDGREDQPTVEDLDLGVELRSPSGVFDLALTSASAVIGTPAYMSREQLAGRRGGPATDQFSLCVSLWEALFGERPFAGADMNALERAILNGDRRPPPKSSKVPERIVRALIRGLSAEPDARWPSMQALIDELEGVMRRARRRPRIALGAVALLAVVSGGVWLESWLVDRGVAACEAQGGRVEALWDAARRREVSGTLAGAGPYGVEAKDRVLVGLDAWTARWTEVASAACRGSDAVPEALEVAQMVCLERGLDTLDQTIALLGQAQGEDALVNHAVELLGELPDPRRCAEVQALLILDEERGADGEPERFDHLRRELDRAEVLARAGRWDAVVEALTPLRDEPGLERYPRLEAELMGALGWASYERRDSEAAIEELTRAYELALGAGDDERAAEIAVDLMMAHTRGVARLDEARAWDLQARALLDRIDAGPRARAGRLAALGLILDTQGDFEGARVRYSEAAELLEGAEGRVSLRRARLLDDLGAAHVALGQLERGRELELESLEILTELLGSTHPELASVHYKLGSAAFAASDGEQARLHFERSVEIGAPTLGADAALVLAATTGLGVAKLLTDDPAGARELFARVLESGERRFGLEHLELVPPLVNLCAVDIELGALDEAERSCARALAILEATHGDAHPSLVAPLDNLGDIFAQRGDARGAQGFYLRSLAIGEASYGPAHSELDYARVGLGEAAAALGQSDEARARFEAVLAGRGGEGKHAELLARAEFGLAQLERAAGREAAARVHAQRAVEDLRGASEPADAQLEAIEAWLG